MTRPPNHGPWGRRDPENSQGDDHPEWNVPGERRSNLGCVVMALAAVVLWSFVGYRIGHLAGWW